MERSTEPLAPIVLGATIAIGSCTLAACDDPPQPPPIEPIAATQPVVEEDEPDEVLFDAEAGRLGTLDASPGFTPDPMTRQGTLAGGPFDASEIDDGCAGWIDAEPDYVLEARRPFAELAVMSASRSETTLVIVGPDGDVRCGGEGEHALVRGVFEVGIHRVWIGAQERGANAPYVMAISELDDTVPSSLLH